MVVVVDANSVALGVFATIAVVIVSTAVAVLVQDVLGPRR